MKLTYRFASNEKRDQAINILNQNKGKNINDVDIYFNDKDSIDHAGPYVLDVYISDFDEETIEAFGAHDLVKEDYEKEETKDEYSTVKKILKYTAIGLIGVFIGRKTCRYKRFKSTFKIFADPSWTDDSCRAAANIMDQLVARMDENNLVFCVDKKLRRK